MPPVKSFINSSLLDYEGYVSSVVFLPHCNYRCPACHNKQLVLEPKTLDDVPEKDISDYLNSTKKINAIDAVVISGGEPTLHRDLPDLCQKIKDFDFLVKIDTNGSNPLMLENLIRNKLVDYIAMDIKTSLEPERYSKASGTNITEAELENIKFSIELIKDMENYEFRTTCVPTFVTKDDLFNIAYFLNKVHATKTFYLQQFRPENLINSELEKIKPYSKEEMKKFQCELKPYFQKIGLRGI